MFNLFVTKSQLEAILSAAGTNLQEVARKAAEQSNLVVAETTSTIEHDRQLIADAQRRINDCNKALKQSNKVLRLVSKLIS